MKKILTTLLLCVPLALTACGHHDATVASKNLSDKADNFELDRRIVFYNGITGEYILTIEGKCSFSVVTENKIDVTCKTGKGEYKKHSLGISDNVTYFSEQVDSHKVSVYHYEVNFKPSTIIPSVNVDLPNGDK